VSIIWILLLIIPVVYNKLIFTTLISHDTMLLIRNIVYIRMNLTYSYLKIEGHE